MEIDPEKTAAFEMPDDFNQWLAAHHASESELWVKIYRKGSATVSINWEQAVIEALAWGWIDGIKKSGGDDHWFQRFTPRKPKSIWSRKNRGHVEKLIVEGRMRAPGLKTVEAAKADGRWEAAYGGSSDTDIPAYFLAELEKHAEAKEAYDKLSRSRLLVLSYRLNSAKKEDTRRRRMAKIIDDLTTKGTVD
jgi:uncharacterized protein YdeI (YjbR/CyaY-like superfamily)